jgi:hypothetical protein
MSNFDYALSYASDDLQNDKELLLILEKGNKSLNNNEKWYKERVEVLAKYKEQELLENKLNKSIIVKKTKKI